MKIAVPEQKKLVHETTIPVRWGDMDALGHVNNTLYFRYLEIARVEWLQRVGGPPNASGEGPIIVNTFCNFLRQLKYPGAVRVHLYTGEMGRSSLDTWATMERVDEPGQLCATGGATVVWADLLRQRSAPLPEWLRARIHNAG